MCVNLRVVWYMFCRPWYSADRDLWGGRSRIRLTSEGKYLAVNVAHKMFWSLVAASPEYWWSRVGWCCEWMGSIALDKLVVICSQIVLETGALFLFHHEYENTNLRLDWDLEKNHDYQQQGETLHWTTGPKIAAHFSGSRYSGVVIMGSTPRPMLNIRWW